MKTIVENIYKFSHDNIHLNIECATYILSIPIIDGTAQVSIIDIDNNNIGVNGLDINDSIKIYYKKINNNIIKPIKIIKIYNYIFNDDSSSSDNEIII
jgi:hypothetical protein